MTATAAPARRRGLLARREDAHCVVYHVLVVAAYALAFWLWLHPEVSGLTDAWRRAAFVAAAAPLLGWIAGIDVGVNFHNHAHRRIFTVPWLNRWFARLWTPVGGWPWLWWRHLHVTVHHAHLLGARDWTVPRRGADGRFESSLAYQLRHWPWRTAVHFGRDVRDGHFARREALVELGWFLLVWSIPFWIDVPMALCLWVLPHWCANCITMGRGMYVQHAGCEGFGADRTLPHSNSFLLPFYNRTMFNIGYHGLHHDEPGVHWADLPDVHARLAAQTQPPHAAAPAQPHEPGAMPRS